MLDEIVQVRRDTKAARRLVMRLLKKQGMVPRRMITDKLRFYGAAKRQVMPGVEHHSHKSLNNRAENSHLPFRKRERMRQGFRSIGSFVPLFSAVRNLFVPDHTKPSANQIRNHRPQAMAQWKAVSGQLVRKLSHGLDSCPLMPALITLSSRSDFELMPPLVVGTALLMT